MKKTLLIAGTVLMLTAVMSGSSAAEKKTNADGEIRVALIGSSACQTYGNKDPRLIFGWGEVIQKQFKPNVKILNFAVSGYSSKMFIDRGNWAKTLAAKPNYVFLTIGANDSKPGAHRYTAPNTTYRANILKFIRETRSIGAEPIIVTLNQSMGYDKKTGKPSFYNGKFFRKSREPYNQVLRAIAKEENLVCLDLAKCHQSTVEALGEKEAATMYRVFDLKTMKQDPTHTNLKGAEFIAGLLADELAKSSSPLKAYLAR